MDPNFYIFVPCREQSLTSKAIFLPLIQLAMYTSAGRLLASRHLWFYIRTHENKWTKCDKFSFLSLKKRKFKNCFGGWGGRNSTIGSTRVPEIDTHPWRIVVCDGIVKTQTRTKTQEHTILLTHLPVTKFSFYFASDISPPRNILTSA